MTVETMEKKDIGKIVVRNFEEIKEALDNSSIENPATLNYAELLIHGHNYEKKINKELKYNQIRVKKNGRKENASCWEVINDLKKKIGKNIPYDFEFKNRIFIEEKAANNNDIFNFLSNRDLLYGN